MKRELVALAVLATLALGGCASSIPSAPPQITDNDPVAEGIRALSHNCHDLSTSGEDPGGYLEFDCPGKFVAENTSANDQKWFFVISNHDSCDALEADPEFNSSTTGWVYVTNWLIHSTSSDYPVSLFEKELDAEPANFYEIVCTSGLVPLDLADPSPKNP